MPKLVRVPVPEQPNHDAVLLEKSTPSVKGLQVQVGALKLALTQSEVRTDLERKINEQNMAQMLLMSLDNEDLHVCAMDKEQKKGASKQTRQHVMAALGPEGHLWSNTVFRQRQRR